MYSCFSLMTSEICLLFSLVSDYFPYSLWFWLGGHEFLALVFTMEIVSLPSIMKGSFSRPSNLCWQFFFHRSKNSVPCPVGVSVEIPAVVMMLYPLYYIWYVTSLLKLSRLFFQLTQCFNYSMMLVEISFLVLPLWCSKHLPCRNSHLSLDLGSFWL